jgi:soluble lytic murein transglycosylase-like protein
MRSQTAVFVASVLVASGAGAHTAIYSFVDADGIKHYTDIPDDNRYRLLVLSPHELTESGEHYNPNLLARAAQYDAIIEGAAAKAALEANLLRAVIVVESGFNSRAVSRRGAVGLMQVMPATGSRFGVGNLYDPRQNVEAGASYLKFLMEKFGHNVQLVLAAYNAGEDAVARNGGRIPPFAETLAYVPKVLKVYRMLANPPQSRTAGHAAGPRHPLLARLDD